MKQDLRKTKIKILSEDHNKAIQEAVFTAGGEWQHSGEFYRGGINYIFINSALGMTFCDNAVFFQEHGYKEIQFPLPTKDIYTKHKEDTQMKRKVREDFNPTKEYSVNVSECTEDEKKEVQQAFFDAGFPWHKHGEVYKCLDAVQYSNAYTCGEVNTCLMHGNETNSCNMTAKEFLDLVYEPEQVGHIHAELMAQYAEDAKTSMTPWKLWQVKGRGDTWYSCQDHPKWGRDTKYSRKPKTRTINGVEVPVFEFTPKVGEKYYAANVGLPELFEQGYRGTVGCTFTERMIERGLIYPYTEEGKQAAILHSKAMLGIAYLSNTHHTHN